MHRRGSITALVASLALVTVSAACSTAPEEKIVKDFFRAARLRDSATLGTFATASFEPRTDGQVQDLKVVSIGPERTTPLPLREYTGTLDSAKSAQEAFERDKGAYQAANGSAIQRIIEAEQKNKPVAKKDAAVQTAWHDWRDKASQHFKAVSDARVQLNNMKGLAELSLSRPNGPTPDVTQLTGALVQKEVTIDAGVRTPDGQTVRKPLVVTLERCVMTDPAGKTLTGRWIVTRVREAQGGQKTT